MKLKINTKNIIGSFKRWGYQILYFPLNIHASEGYSSSGNAECCQKGQPDVGECSETDVNMRAIDL
jgi:hypothetical protein